jgi:hypothetical protein
VRSPAVTPRGSFLIRDRQPREMTMVELDEQQVVEVSGGRLPMKLYPTSFTGPALYVDGVFWGYLNP